MSATQREKRVDVKLDVNKNIFKNLIIKAWYILIHKMNGYLRNLWIQQEEIQKPVDVWLINANE